jgi:hypothetical protein
MPVAHKNVYKRLPLDHVGAENAISEHTIACARQSGSLAAEDVLLEQLREEELRGNRDQGKRIRLGPVWLSTRRYWEYELLKTDDPDPGTQSHRQFNNMIQRIECTMMVRRFGRRELQEPGSGLKPYPGLGLITKIRGQ